ncbi:CopG family transcriptional regulator [Roseateles sp. BYS78W]
MNSSLAPQDQAELDRLNTESVEHLPGSGEGKTDAGAEHIGAESSTLGSGEPTGSEKRQGTRKKGAGTVKVKGVRKPRSAKSRVANTGAGKSHAVTTKLDAELLRKLTMARARSGMSESGMVRLALVSYLDNLEQRSIAAEISKAAAAITAASHASTAPVVEKLNTLEHRFQEQLGAVVNAIKGIGKLLGEPVDLAGLDGLTDAGESKGGKS